MKKIKYFILYILILIFSNLITAKNKNHTNNIFGSWILGPNKEHYSTLLILNADSTFIIKNREDENSSLAYITGRFCLNKDSIKLFYEYNYIYRGNYKINNSNRLFIIFDNKTLVKLKDRCERTYALKLSFEEKEKLIIDFHSFNRASFDVKSIKQYLLNFK